MKVELLGRLTTFGKVGRGVLFQYAVRENVHLGTKVWDQSGEGRLAFNHGYEEAKGGQ